MIKIKNIALKKKWVAALRSGEYKQGQKLLRKGNKFCCLGVLCDIATNGKFWYGYIAEEYADQVLPVAIMKKLGFNRGADPNVTIPRRGSLNAVTLTQLNDEEGKSFKKIADIIEEQL